MSESAGFEETTYLLLFGSCRLPASSRSLTILASYRSLPTSFVRDLIMKRRART